MSIKDKLARGEVVSMINPDHPSPSLVEFIGGLGFDAIFIDCEHGMAGIERVQEMCRAARCVGATPIIRPDTNAPWLITRYFDAGAEGVMVPHIETAEDAKNLVSAVRYARHSDHASKLVITLLESKQALSNIAEIAAVDGIDVLFVGPGDLSNSLGLPGQRFHPTVREQVMKAGQQINSLGKPSGTLVRSDNAAEYIANGFTFIYEHANAFLLDGANRFNRETAIRNPRNLAAK